MAGYLVYTGATVDVVLIRAPKFGVLYMQIVECGYGLCSCLFAITQGENIKLCKYDFAGRTSRTCEDAQMLTTFLLLLQLSQALTFQYLLNTPRNAVEFGPD